MYKPRLNQVFRSRWHALWWAAGICVTAYCSVPQSKAPDQPVVKQQTAKHDHAAKWWMKDSGAKAG